MKDGYAVRLCADGTIDIVKLEEGDHPIAKTLGCAWIDDADCAEAVNLPIAEKFMLCYDLWDLVKRKSEKNSPKNRLAEVLSDGHLRVCGDVLLVPVTKGEDGIQVARGVDGEERLLGMPHSVAEIVALVCNACRYALENGIFETLIRKDAEE